MTAVRAARSKAEEMGQRALVKAHKADPEFTDTFMTLLRLYARKMEKTGLTFTGEEFRLWAYKRGLPLPPDARCVGPLFAKAMRDGVIRHRGFAPTISSNGSLRRAYTRGVL